MYEEVEREEESGEEEKRDRERENKEIEKKGVRVEKRERQRMIRGARTVNGLIILSDQLRGDRAGPAATHS